ncbi:DNA-binding transcriptional regulator, XRE-family HTH domain [Marinobacter sp. es.048]|uniref:helix-turn-helix domain-containing protein n=1 Tax=Marinobacter sp. es.048 TaxID=1761795 RepID=UPI000B58F761|nr:helix-turn-helix transcriptional regulator [Marinobacter sp. es.048]SNC68103.1 DNA-binding transcriptional regulator, XRE-family HTH domain [Marinobacter sp. es.048]
MNTKASLVAAVNEEIERLQTLANTIEASTEPDLRPLADLADVLKARREDLDLTPNDVSELGGLSPNTYRAMEGGTGNPTIQTLKTVGQVLNFKVWIELK